MKKTALLSCVVLSVSTTVFFIGGCEKQPPINTTATQNPPPIKTPESTSSDAKPTVQTDAQTEAQTIAQPTNKTDTTANTTTTLYKCKTDSGVTFSDSPCGGQQETVVLKEPMVVDNSGLRAKAAQWKEQDAEDDANRTKNNKPKAILIGDSSGNRDTDAENGSDQTDMNDDLGTCLKYCRMQTEMAELRMLLWQSIPDMRPIIFHFLRADMANHKHKKQRI